VPGVECTAAAPVDAARPAVVAVVVTTDDSSSYDAACCSRFEGNAVAVVSEYFPVSVDQHYCHSIWKSLSSSIKE